MIGGVASRLPEDEVEYEPPTTRKMRSTTDDYWSGDRVQFCGPALDEEMYRLCGGEYYRKSGNCHRLI